MKSASQTIHEQVSKMPIGWEFTFHDLIDLLDKNIPGHGISDGAFSGYINRGQRKGSFSVLGKIKGPRGTSYKYQLIDTDAWRFKHSGIGSLPGRTSNKHMKEGIPVLDQTELPLDDPKRREAYDYLYNQIPKDEITFASPKGWEMATKAVDEFSGIIDQKKIEYEEGSLSDQLVELAIKINALENKPEKQLSDYTSEQLIEELRRRLHDQDHS